MHVYILFYFYCFINSLIGSSLQACTAMSPDEQLNILKDMWQKEKNVEIVISKEDNETIAYYLNEVRLYFTS